MKKVGIMGGTFDPIHIGHLILAEKAYEQFQLDTVLIMPSGNPPHKTRRQGASNDQRVDMVQLAIQNNPHFTLSLEEMHEDGYVYTSKTLTRLCQEHPDTEYYFIMGADSLLAFDTWRDPQIICDHAVLVVAVRDHLSDTQLDAAIEETALRYHAVIRKLITPNIDVASSLLREWIAEGKSARYYIPDSVADYISANNVYQEDQTYEPV